MCAYVCVYALVCGGYAHTFKSTCFIYVAFVQTGFGCLFGRCAESGLSVHVLLMCFCLRLPVHVFVWTGFGRVCFVAVQGVA